MAQVVCDWGDEYVIVDTETNEVIGHLFV